MAGDGGVGLTDRDHRILETVRKLGLISRDQLIRLGLFSSPTRAKERLKRLVEHDYLSARPQTLPAGGPRLIYSLGRNSSEPGVRPRRTQELSELFLRHELGLVDIHIAAETSVTLSRWMPAQELGEMRVGLIPDAFAEYQHHGFTYCAFIEYDRGTETVERFERKITAYLRYAASGQFPQTFGRKFFRVWVVTDGERRLESLSRAAARHTDKLFRFTTLKSLTQEGLLSSIWRRPGRSDRELLTAA